MRISEISDEIKRFRTALPKDPVPPVISNVRFEKDWLFKVIAIGQLSWQAFTAMSSNRRGPVDLPSFPVGQQVAWSELPKPPHPSAVLRDREHQCSVDS